MANKEEILETLNVIINDISDSYKSYKHSLIMLKNVIHKRIGWKYVSFTIGYKEDTNVVLVVIDYHEVNVRDFFKKCAEVGRPLLKEEYTKLPRG